MPEENWQDQQPLEG